MKKMVVGLVEERQSAQNIVDDLIENDFEKDDIGVVARDEQGEYAAERKAIGGVEKGAQRGASVGGAGGLIMGLTTMAAVGFPGIGVFSLVGAGPIVMTLVGAGAGAVAGGLIGALTDMGVSEKEARYFAAGVRQGDILVTVSALKNDVRKAEDIMNRHGAITSWDEKNASQRKKELNEDSSEEEKS